MKLPFVKTKPNVSRPMLAPAMPYILIVGGIIGTICSFILSNDTIDSLKNPHFVPSCNINPVLSCGSVMHSAQGAAFGFPNPYRSDRLYGYADGGRSHTSRGEVQAMVLAGLRGGRAGRHRFRILAPLPKRLSYPGTLSFLS